MVANSEYDKKNIVLPRHNHFPVVSIEGLGADATSLSGGKAERPADCRTGLCRFPRVAGEKRHEPPAGQGHCHAGQSRAPGKAQVRPAPHRQYLRNLRQQPSAEPRAGVHADGRYPFGQGQGHGHSFCQLQGQVTSRRHERVAARPAQDTAHQRAFLRRHLGGHQPHLW